MHENEWWPNATHNLKNQIDRKYELVLSRINHLEIMLIQKRAIDFYGRISLLDLRFNLELLFPNAISGINLTKIKCSNFLKGKLLECVNFLKGIDPSYYQNMSLNEQQMLQVA